MSAEKLNPVNPGPLGLLGFGMTTILLNLHNAEIIPLSIVIVAMGFALGGARSDHRRNPGILPRQHLWRHRLCGLRLFLVVAGPDLGLSLRQHRRRRFHLPGLLPAALGHL